LKVPQPKFRCPDYAPAAEKFWRRHCSVQRKLCTKAHEKVNVVVVDCKLNTKAVNERTRELK